jgi:hypothetical protein
VICDFVYKLCTNCAYQLCVQIVCTSCVYQLCVQIMCTNCAYQFCVQIMCTSFVYQLCTNCACQLRVPILCETFIMLSTVVRNDHNCISLCMYSTGHCCQIVMKPELYRQMFETPSNIKFHEFTSSGSQQTDGQTWRSQ